MSKRDYIKEQIDILPEDILENLMDFISFQKRSLGMDEKENDCPLLGIAEDCGLTVDKFLKMTYKDKELER